MAHHASEPESGREQVRAADAVGNRFAIDWVHGVQQGCCQRKRPAAERIGAESPYERRAHAVEQRVCGMDAPRPGSPHVERERQHRQRPVGMVRAWRGERSAPEVGAQKCGPVTSHGGGDARVALDGTMVVEGVSVAHAVEVQEDRDGRGERGVSRRHVPGSPPASFTGTVGILPVPPPPR